MHLQQWFPYPQKRHNFFLVSHHGCAAPAEIFLESLLKFFTFSLPLLFQVRTSMGLAQLLLIVIKPAIVMLQWKTR